MINFLKSLFNLISFYRLNSSWKNIVFFSEGSNYYSVYEQIINDLLKRKKKITFITADYKDQIYLIKDDNLKIFYSKNIYTHILFLNFIKCKNLIMTMPDIDNFEIKKSKNVEKYIYLFHSLVSCHMIYRNKAFHNYDLIHCSTYNQYNELVKLKNYYNSNYKLIKSGYQKINNISKNYAPNNLKKNSVVIAPSWGSKNILNTCLEELISILIKNSYNVTLRPHSQFIKNNNKIINNLVKMNDRKRLFIDTSNSDFAYVLNSEFLITDWSGISMEYSFITYRPVLFINIPKKINNSKFNEINLEPIEAEIRKKIGAVVNLDEIHLVPSILNQLNTLNHKEKILKIKNELLISDDQFTQKFLGNLS